MPQVSKQKVQLPTKPSPRKPTTQTSPSDSAWDFAEGVQIMLYGQSGTGKTTLWATFPGPILCLVCSGRKRPGELKSIDTPEYRAKITPKIVTSMSQVAQHLSAMKDYETVVLDHVSGLVDLCLKEQLGLDELPAQKSWGLATLEMWGIVTGMVKDVVLEMLGNAGNVVIIGQERTTEAKEGSEIQFPRIGIEANPKLAGWLNSTVDYIAQTYIAPVMQTVKVNVAGEIQEMVERGKGVHYCLRIAPHDVFTTKFRVPKDKAKSLPESVIDPTYDKILKAIGGKK